MSLEVAILENTATLRELIARISNLFPTTTVADAVAAIAKPKAVKTAPAPAAEPAAAPAATASAEAPVPAPAAVAAGEPVEAFTVADASRLVVKHANAKGRDAAVALLKTFDAPKATELKPEQIENYCLAVTAALAA